jgi:hypothetical protein
MNGGQIGEIPLEDYIKIVGTKKTPPVKRLARVAGIVALCTLCMAAGDYLGPWSGKRARDLSFEQALAMVENHGPQAHVRSAAEQLRRYCKRSIQALGALKQRDINLAATADAILLGIEKLAQQARQP